MWYSIPNRNDAWIGYFHNERRRWPSRCRRRCQWTHHCRNSFSADFRDTPLRNTTNPDVIYQFQRLSSAQTWISLWFRTELLVREKQSTMTEWDWGVSWWENVWAGEWRLTRPLLNNLINKQIWLNYYFFLEFGLKVLFGKKKSNLFFSFASFLSFFLSFFSLDFL